MEYYLLFKIVKNTPTLDEQSLERKTLKTWPGFILDKVTVNARSFTEHYNVIDVNIEGQVHNLKKLHYRKQHVWIREKNTQTQFTIYTNGRNAQEKAQELTKFYKSCIKLQTPYTWGFIDLPYLLRNHVPEMSNYFFKIHPGQLLEQRPYILDHKLHNFLYHRFPKDEQLQEWRGYGITLNNKYPVDKLKKQLQSITKELQSVPKKSSGWKYLTSGAIPGITWEFILASKTIINQLIAPYSADYHSLNYQPFD